MQNYASGLLDHLIWYFHHAPRVAKSVGGSTRRGLCTAKLFRASALLNSTSVTIASWLATPFPATRSVWPLHFRTSYIMPPQPSSPFNLPLPEHRLYFLLAHSPIKFRSINTSHDQELARNGRTKGSNRKFSSHPHPLFHVSRESSASDAFDAFTHFVDYDSLL